MTDNEIRIAIAEACGWVKYAEAHSGGWLYQKLFGNSTVTAHEQNLPDYPNNLNAMHEAEKVLSQHDQGVFVNQLYNTAIVPAEVEYGPLTLSEIDIRWMLSHATARQRAEAFLRILGKWKDA